ncbi:MAG: alcohol dehydrogenase catalytic domain-containing protein [Cyanobacteriota bacterium ELA615]
MKAIWLEDKQIELRENLPVPAPKSGEALVKVLKAGICNTDLELVKGYYPYRGIIGHEFVGVVEQGSQQLKNQRVVGEINASCGNCDYCLGGIKTHCPNRTVLGIVNRHGAFAQYLTLPIENLHIVPSNVKTEVATFTEPIAAALQIQQQISITPKTKVLVVGDGKLGLLVAQTLSLRGCDLQVIGRHQDKLDLLKELGINTNLEAIAIERKFDVAIECTGNSAGFELARFALKPRGTLILKSTYAGKLKLDASALVVDEITVLGSRCGPFDLALQLLAENRLNIEPMISGSYELSDGLSAFTHAQRRGTLKILLDVN